MPKIYKDKKELITNFIKNDDVVLDVGFWGQGIKSYQNNWPHKLIREQAKEVYGLDLDFNQTKFSGDHYLKASAEHFDFPVKFDAIFAGDLIEHLSNPGLFLASCRRNLKDDGRLIITTPNCFNFFNIAEKITKAEPTVNSDHVCYFNTKTISKLLGKNNFTVGEISFLYDPGVDFKESWKKKFLNFWYFIASRFTAKFMETLVVVSQKK
ncbi:MAG: methyltransferase domain-containing protein [Parcubacteria group bacterium]